MARGLVRCDLCEKEFEKPNREINWARKRGYRIFCSDDCRKKAKTRSEIRKCLTCGCDVKVKQGVIERSKTGKFYCSQSCAAKTRNIGRHRTDEEKRKISSALFGRRRIETSECGNIEYSKEKYIGESECVVCGKKFSYSIAKKRITCSVACGHILRFEKLPATKEEVLTEICRLHSEMGCSPSSKMIARRFVYAAFRFFGSWNKAIKGAGFSPNLQWMIKRNLLCKDGHHADSLSERMVDDWLSKHNIAHERRKKYPGVTKMDCDFYLTDSNLWMEYFGLYGEHSSYDATVEEKRRIAGVFHLSLVELFPKHIYPEMVIGDVLAPFLRA